MVRSTWSKSESCNRGRSYRMWGVRKEGWWGKAVRERWRTWEEDREEQRGNTSRILTFCRSSGSTS